MQLNAALFHIDTRNEIVVLSNTGGRSVFQNVGGTRRDGVELSLDAKLGRGIGLVGAYTWLKAEYAENFLTCNVAPCTTPNLPIAAGNAMPGIPRTMLYAELSWKHSASGFASALEIRRVGQVYVDDANSDAAAAYTTANLRLGFEQDTSGWRVNEFLRIDNLGDGKYAGSVIVNEGNRRYFEPAPGRNWLVGINGRYEF
jgi:iron complex outermembrane receptor protein